MSSSLERLVTTVSTTPRTAQRHVETLERMRCDPSVTHEILYTEAKVALQGGDTALARTLLEQCPKEYRNSSTYRSQVDMYDTMCHKGILRRRNSDDVMGLLCSILRCDSDDTVVRQYCDRLMCNGYNQESIQSLTMGSVDLAMQTCHMSPGHRCLFERYVQERTPLSERILMSIVAATERCAITECVRAVSQHHWRREDETHGDGPTEMWGRHTWR